MKANNSVLKRIEETAEYSKQLINDMEEFKVPKPSRPKSFFRAEVIKQSSADRFAEGFRKKYQEKMKRRRP
ncbi:MAG: hypothetical protein GF401_00025 [Chitinivibrionales bacterium]|nr:hypothetical protein [Chitinivibrionales bacterium]